MPNFYFAIFRHGLRIFTVLVSVVMTSASFGCSFFKPEIGFTNKISTASVIGAVTTTGTLGQCYHQCIKELGCMSFFYNKITGVCQLHATVFLRASLLQTETGYDYYRINNDVCRRESGYMLNRNLGTCFTLIVINPPYTLNVIRSRCDAVGGTLMVVDTETKRVMVGETARYFHPKKAVIMGLSRSSVPEDWIWENNHTLMWSKWAVTEPSTGNDDLCAFMDNNLEYVWNAAHCTQKWRKLAACGMKNNMA